ncbi:hypothetical protein PsAD37_00877 [Pseudovibrio sp. Ad37]|nr:hypothetical protein PsAD37_00877 [Pseudovibrio sp. Ad37]
MGVRPWLRSRIKCGMTSEGRLACILKRPQHKPETAIYNGSAPIRYAGCMPLVLINESVKLKIENPASFPFFSRPGYLPSQSPR